MTFLILFVCVCVEAVDFLSQVLDSPELDAVRDAVQNLQDIGESLRTTVW